MNKRLLLVEVLDDFPVAELEIWVEICKPNERLWTGYGKEITLPTSGDISCEASNRYETSGKYNAFRDGAWWVIKKILNECE